MQARRVAGGAVVGQDVGMSKSDGINRTRVYRGTPHEVTTYGNDGNICRVEMAPNRLGAQQILRRATEQLQTDGYRPLRSTREQTVLRNEAGDTVTLRIKPAQQAL